MKREIKKCLFDINTSIDSIYDYLGGERDFLEYQKNKLLRRGIEWEIEIIGEAVHRILKIDPDFNIVSASQMQVHPDLDEQYPGDPKGGEIQQKQKIRAIEIHSPGNGNAFFGFRG